LRKAFSLADKLEPLWDEAQLAAEGRRLEPLDARRSCRLQTDGRRTPLPPRRGRWKRATGGSFRRGTSRTGRPPPPPAQREVSEEAGVRARPDPAPAARRAETGRGMDLHRVLPQCPRTPGARHRSRSAESAGSASTKRSRPSTLEKSRRLLRSADRLVSLSTAEEPAAPSHPPRRRALCRVLVLGALALLRLAAAGGSRARGAKETLVNQHRALRPLPLLVRMAHRIDDVRKYNLGK